MSSAPIHPKNYHILTLSPNGTLRQAEIAPLENDRKAIRYVQAIRNGSAMELWDGLRCIRKFGANG